jgi:hypothetical protein
MPSPSEAERGSVTAEFAVAMPAVLLVLATALGGVQLAGLQLRLQDASADAARGLGRGDSSAQVEQILGRQVPGATVTVTKPGDVVCARLTAAPEWPTALVGIRVEAMSCALDDAR